MNTIGFPISHKENENRRAIVPTDLISVKNTNCLYFETGYGVALGYEDSAYADCGAHLVSRDEVLAQNIICDPKIGDAEYLEKLKGQTVFGWVHAVQNRDITDKLLGGKLSAVAWEDMFEKGRHTFYRNNEIAGEAAVMHAFQCYGEMPYNTKVAVLGRGNVASGAMKILTMLGAEVVQYSRTMEQLFREELPEFDVIVNAILWDTSRKDHIIYRNDLKRLKPNSLIIDVSCDRNGGIESSIPTTIETPVYYEQGVMHYVVDHTPSLFAKTATKSISAACCKYMDKLICGQDDDVISGARCITNGIIMDERINAFQGR